MIKTEIISMMVLAAIVIPSVAATVPTTGSMIPVSGTEIDLQSPITHRIVMSYAEINNFDLADRNGNDGLIAQIVNSDTGEILHESEIQVMSNGYTEFGNPTVDFNTFIGFAAETQADKYSENIDYFITPGTYELRTITWDGQFIGSTEFTVIDSR